MKKGILVIIAVLLLLFIGGIAYIYSSIGSVISDTISQQGSAITQTKVSVGTSEYSTTSGLATLSQIHVANPAGFKSALALNIGQIDLWIDPESLSSNVIRVKSLVLQAPEVTYEIVDHTDNLRVLKLQIEETIKRAQNHPPEKRLLIERLQIKNGVVVVKSDELSGARKTAQLAPITLNNVGLSQGGVSPAELAHILTLEILRETTIAALNTDLPLSDQARNILNGALDETQKALLLFKGLLK